MALCKSYPLVKKEKENPLFLIPSLPHFSLVVHAVKLIKRTFFHHSHISFEFNPGSIYVPVDITFDGLESVTLALLVSNITFSV